MPLPSLTRKEKLVLVLITPILLGLITITGLAWIKTQEYASSSSPSRRSLPLSQASPLPSPIPSPQPTPSPSLRATQLNNLPSLLSHPAVRDISLRVEGKISKISGEQLEIIQDNQPLLLSFDSQTKFYFKKQDETIQLTDYQSLQTGQSLEVSLSRQADGTFRVSTIQINE